MKIIVSKTRDAKYNEDLRIYCIDQKVKNKANVSGKEFPKSFLKACELGDFQAKDDDVMLEYESEKTMKKPIRFGYVGVGQLSKNAPVDELRERMRKIGGNIAKLCKKVKAARVCIIPPDTASEYHFLQSIYALTEGVYLGNYTFSKYQRKKKESKDNYTGITGLKYICKYNLNKVRQMVNQAKLASFSACEARNMANEPGNKWTSESFAEYAKQLAEKSSLRCSVFSKTELKKLGMGGILAVNSGSQIPPKLVILEHKSTKEKAKTLLLVGKGLTFDSGGISIKPASGMEDMKYDMCGGAAVLAAMNAVAEEKPSCNVIAMVPATDNMSGSAALKPGDIIEHYGKTTSEIINTDAEGRLILADALAFGIEKYAPDYVIDLATLTGAVIIGLGHHHSGVFSNNKKYTQKLINAGKKCGEPLWRLPLGPDYRKQLDSKVADIKNTGGRPAGSITAAEYLQEFVGKTAWAHLDIAGTAWNFTEKTYIPEGGPTGMGVRTLIEFIREF